jgi:hypothetical protein
VPGTLLREAAPAARSCWSGWRAAIKWHLRRPRRTAATLRARARSTGAVPPASAAGRTREEDHALCPRVGLRVVLPMTASAPTRRRVDRRHGAHIPSSSWRRNSSTRSSLLLAVSRDHPRRRSTPPSPASCAAASRGDRSMPTAPQPKHHRAGPVADVAEAVRRTAALQHLLACRRPPAGRAAGSQAASVDEWVQPEPWAAPSAWRGPGISTSWCRRRNVSIAVAVATGHDYRLQGRAAGSPPPADAGSARSAADQHERLGMFGVTTVAADSRSRSSPTACSSSRRAPGLGHHHRVDHDRTRPGSGRGACDRLDRRLVARASRS